jgi:MoxR-like ATPase
VQGAFFFIWICGTFFICSAALANADCTRRLEALRKNPEIIGMTIRAGEKGQLLFAPENRTYFKMQRDALRKNYRTLFNRYAELEHYIRRITETLMIRQNLWADGDPGGAKSAVARDFLNVRVPRPDPQDPSKNIYQLDRFILQFDQFTSESQLKGFVDPHSGEIRDFNTLMHYRYGLLDEIDKANPAALGALLAMLQEREALHGGVIKRARTQSIIQLSNMNNSEIIHAFSVQLMEATARALLDRSAYKVWVPDWITNSKRRRQIVDTHAIRQNEKALKRLGSPELEFGRTEAETISQNDSQDSDLQYVNFEWLGDLVSGQSQFGRDEEQHTGKGLVLLEGARNLVDSMVGDMRNHYRSQRRASETYRLQNPSEDAPLYYPPTVGNSRTYISHAYNTVIASVFLDLLLLPEEVMPTDRLLIALERPGGIPIDYHSVYRLHELLLIGAPGDPQFVPPSARGASGTSVVFSEELKTLSQNPFDRRGQWTLQMITEDRKFFFQKFEDNLNFIRSAAHNCNDILTRHLGPDIPGLQTDFEGIEEILYHLRVMSSSKGS